MALVVENGTGLSNAESYVSVADASAYLASLGDTTFSGLADDTAREQALRKATNYMEQRYRGRWKGERLTRSQGLSWPRFDAEVDGWYVDVDIVPPEVEHGCALLAVKSVTETLNDDLAQQVIREKIGPLETEYNANSPQSKRYLAVDQLLAPFLQGSSSMARLVRV